MTSCRPGERFVMLTSCWAVSRPAAKNSKDEYALHGFYHQYPSTSTRSYALSS